MAQSRVLGVRINRMTEAEKLIIRVALGRKSRARSGSAEHGRGSFITIYLHRLPRNAERTEPVLAKAVVPAHVINREYSYRPHARFYRGGQCENNRRRH